MSNNSDLLALSRAAGRIHWATSLPQWEDPEERVNRILWTGPILVSDRLILAGSNGQALAVSPYSGQITGQVSMPDRVTVPPVVADRSIYFLSDDAELVAYR
jgi:outer membrane protein assembly factor BamB